MSSSLPLWMTEPFVKGVNPIALRTAKTLWSLGCSECNRVKKGSTFGKKNYLQQTASSVLQDLPSVENEGQNDFIRVASLDNAPIHKSP